MKEKIVSMSAKEITAKYGKSKSEIKAMLDAAPEFDIEGKPGKYIGRGFTAFKEYIDKKGKPKTKDPKISVSIRIPSSYVTELRATGRGWQTRLGEYVVNAIKRGDLS